MFFNRNTNSQPAVWNVWTDDQLRLFFRTKPAPVISMRITSIEVETASADIREAFPQGYEPGVTVTGYLDNSLPWVPRVAMGGHIYVGAARVAGALADMGHLSLSWRETDSDSTKKRYPAIEFRVGVSTTRELERLENLLLASLQIKESEIWLDLKPAHERMSIKSIDELVQSQREIVSVPVVRLSVGFKAGRATMEHV